MNSVIFPFLTIIYEKKKKKTMENVRSDAAPYSFQMPKFFSQPCRYREKNGEKVENSMM